MSPVSHSAACHTDIPMPIVTLNRSMLVIGVLAGLATRQPLVTTALFLIVASAALFGRRGSLVFKIGSHLFSRQNAAAISRGHVEDRRMMRLNNTLAALMLGAAQIAFIAGHIWLGWGFALAVAAAASVALAGFCIGCFLYTQWRIRTRGWRQKRPASI